MKRVALLIVALVASACAHVPGPILDFGICLKGAVQSQIPDLISSVETALAGSDYAAQLAKMGAQVGWDVLDCAVHEVLGRARARTLQSPRDAASKTTAEHADAWLTRK